MVNWILWLNWIVWNRNDFLQLNPTYRALSKSNSPQVSWTLLGILADIVVLRSGYESSSNLHFIGSLFQVLDDWSKVSDDDWYYCHLYILQLFSALRQGQGICATCCLLYFHSAGRNIPRFERFFFFFC